MARRPKYDSQGPVPGTENGDGDHDAAGVGHNGINADAVRSHVARIEQLNDHLLTERGEYLSRCKLIRQDIASTYDDARVVGIPKRELKSAVKQRDLLRRADNIRKELEPVEVETFDQIMSALGDLASTPLGAAVLAQHEQQPHA